MSKKVIAALSLSLVLAACNTTGDLTNDASDDSMMEDGINVDVDNDVMVDDSSASSESSDSSDSSSSSSAAGIEAEVQVVD